jgi:hypothetical protein
VRQAVQKCIINYNDCIAGSGSGETSVLQVNAALVGCHRGVTTHLLPLNCCCLSFVSSAPNLQWNDEHACYLALLLQPHASPFVPRLHAVQMANDDTQVFHKIFFLFRASSELCCIGDTWQTGTHCPASNRGMIHRPTYKMPLLPRKCIHDAKQHRNLGTRTRDQNGQAQIL